MTIEDIQSLNYEIQDKTEVLTEGIRHLLSRKLMDTDEKHPMGCNITLQAGFFGMGELEKPTVISMWQEPCEGIIWLQIEDMPEPIELDDIDLALQMDIINALDTMNR